MSHWPWLVWECAPRSIGPNHYRLSPGGWAFACCVLSGAVGRSGHGNLPPLTETVTGEAFVGETASHELSGVGNQERSWDEGSKGVLAPAVRGVGSVRVVLGVLAKPSWRGTWGARR